MKRGRCVNLAIFTSMLIAQCVAVPIREDAPGIEIMPAEISNSGLDYVVVNNRRPDDTPPVNSNVKPAVVQQNSVYQQPYQPQQQLQYFPLEQPQYATVQRPQQQQQQPYWYQQPVYQYQGQPSRPYYEQQYARPSLTGASSSPGILQTIANAFGLTGGSSSTAPAPNSISNRFSIPFLIG
ncbi:uncharacterized protein DDB_G0285291-like [Anopheles aquasalis]|uniref:uncharacterized protein DDB_G0285291-like n=1 Tax=Anopheles aquasalis TaxID=42839 RepID=UPI00215AE685|nr:uncharacterized protein DDB_G0285291-like [Anopheles aquasalis]